MKATKIPAKVKENTFDFGNHTVSVHIVQQDLFTFAKVSATEKTSGAEISAFGFAKCDPSWVYNAQFGEYLAVNRAISEINETFEAANLPQIKETTVEFPKNFKHVTLKDWDKAQKAKKARLEKGKGLKFKKGKTFAKKVDMKIAVANSPRRSIAI